MSNMDNDIREVIGNVIVLHERQSYYVFTGQLSSFLFLTFIKILQALSSAFDLKIHENGEAKHVKKRDLNPGSFFFSMTSGWGAMLIA